MAGVTTNGEFPFAQSIQHPQFFADGPRGEVAAQGAFAGENFLQVKVHGASLRNCRSNFCQAATNPCRARIEFRQRFPDQPHRLIFEKHIHLHRPVRRGLEDEIAARGRGKVGG